MMGKPKKASVAPQSAKVGKVAKSAGAELSETQLDQASGGLIGLLKPEK
jgi:hypothetical protein